MPCLCVDLIKLNGGQYVVIEGPASVEVSRGIIHILGAQYESGSRITILRARKVSLKAVEESELRITLGPGGSLEGPNTGEDIVDEWSRQLSINLAGATVVIMGAMDSGKTTVTTILANMASSRGLKVGVIDADPGQNDLGPPTTINCAILAGGKIIHLSHLKPIRQIFIGTTNLEGSWYKAIDAIVRLVNHLKSVEGVSTILINTDGWIEGGDAIEYKVAMAKSLNPDYIVVLKKGNEADGVINSLINGGFRVIQLNSPPTLRVRDRLDRKIYRDMGYGRFISPSRDITLSLTKVPMVNMPISGKPLESGLSKLITRYLGVKPVYVDMAKGLVTVVTPMVKEPAVKGIPGGMALLLPVNWERGLLVGLEDEGGFLISLAVMKKIYYGVGGKGESRVILAVPRALSDAVLGKARFIRVGSIRLNEQFEEVDKFSIVNKVEKLLVQRQT